MEDIVMRKPERFKSNFAVGFLALITLAGVTASQGAASNLSPPGAETGYPGELINRPVCWSRPGPSDGPRCGGAHPQRHGVRSPFD
jgi:hypothetical protein